MFTIINKPKPITIPYSGNLTVEELVKIYSAISSNAEKQDIFLNTYHVKLAGIIDGQQRPRDYDSIDKCIDTPYILADDRVSEILFSVRVRTPVKGKSLEYMLSEKVLDGKLIYDPNFRRTGEQGVSQIIVGGVMGAGIGAIGSSLIEAPGYLVAAFTLFGAISGSITALPNPKLSLYLTGRHPVKEKLIEIVKQRQ